MLERITVRPALRSRADQLQPLVEALAAADPGSLAAQLGDPASGYVVYEVRRDRLRGD